MSQVFKGSRVVCFDYWEDKPVVTVRKVQKHVGTREEAGHVLSSTCKCRPVIVGEHETLVVWQHTPWRFVQ